MDNRELLWRQYNLIIDQYRGYLELTVKFNVFYYAVTGGMLSYYFAHSTEPLIKWSLLLPVVMSVALCILFLFAARQAKLPQEEAEKIRDTLGLLATPGIGIFNLVLVIFSLLMFLVAGGLIWLLIIT